MVDITHRGNPVHTIGELPAIGSQAPEFRLTDAGLNDLSLADIRGKQKLLNIFPSIGESVSHVYLQVEAAEFK